MPYLLGVDIGSGIARTAVCRRAPELAGWGPPEPLPSDVLPAVSGLFRRCGDDVPVFTDDLFITPQALLVEHARGAADAVWAREQEAPARVALAYPTGWGPGRVGLLRAALDDAGMGGVALVTRARAVLERHWATGRAAADGRVVAVCRIGRAGVEVALVIPYAPGRMELLGSLETEDVGGDDLAEADPAGGRAIMGAVLDLLRRTAAICGVALDDLAAVLTAGGGAAHPLVGEALVEAIAAPVIREDDPRFTIACGAALSVRPQPEVLPLDPLPAPEPLLLPTELMPTTRVPASIDPAGVTIRPGAAPPRPPVHVAAPPVGGR